MPKKGEEREDRLILITIIIPTTSFEMNLELNTEVYTVELLPRETNIITRSRCKTAPIEM